MLEYPAYSGHLLEEADSFYTVLDWNNGEKTYSYQERGENSIYNLKGKTKRKSEMMWGFLLLMRMVLC